jgi:molybdopterin converting factor small subunit
MTVRVRLLGEFRRYLRGRSEPLTCELAAGASVRDLLAELGIEPTAEIVVGVNGQLSGMDSQLSDQDEVILVSPMSGG